MASGDTLLMWMALANEPPASAYATLDTRNSHPVLDFDDTTDEEAVFSGVMPNNYAGGGITITVGWSATDTTVTPHNAVWQAAFEAVPDDTQDMDSDSFAAFQGSGAVEEASASGELAYNTIAFTDGAQMDSVAANQFFRLKIRRDADNTSATDSLTGDAELRFVLMKET
jgi:hypothetical protein